MTWVEKYEISVYEGRTLFDVVLHSPLARTQVVVSAMFFQRVKNDENPPESLEFLCKYAPFDSRPCVNAPEDYTLLTVLPNNRCNFSCSYCYSATCRDMREIDIKALERCIDFFIKSKVERLDRRKLFISFMGGGEPMLSWNVVRDAIIYAGKKAAASEVEMSFRIITNGSLLDDNQLRFIKEYGVGLSISFEILRDIQNLQRRHYELVDSNLLKALDYGIDTQLNVTVTKYNVDRMMETYQAMRKLYPRVKNAMYEPVTSQGLFDSPLDMKEFYDAYIDGFMAIFAEGESSGVGITSFPYLRTVFPLKRACPGEFCVTAEGNITGCYCVSTQAHPLFARTIYGKVGDDTITFDNEQYRRLLSHNVNSNQECKNCQARWNCGGGCFYQFNTYDREYRDVVCDFTRRFVEKITVYRAYNGKKDRINFD